MAIPKSTPSVLTRTCTKCGRVFPATSAYFYRSSHGRFGLRSWCKECAGAYNKVYDAEVLASGPSTRRRVQRGSVCIIPGCDAPHIARGYCSRHYYLLQYYGDPTHPGWQPPPPCVVEGCVRPHHCRGYCKYHYETWRKFGYPTRRQAREALAPKRWFNAKGYASIYVPEHPNANARGGVLEHVYVMSHVLGRAIRPGETVHHRNGIRDDNRPENLELWDGNHSNGQRVVDKIAWCLAYLEEHMNTPALWPGGVVQYPGARSGELCTP